MEKMLEIRWYQLLKYVYFLLFSVLYDCKLNIFGFWNVDQTKRAIVIYLGLWEIAMGISPFFYNC